MGYSYVREHPITAGLGDTELIPTAGTLPVVRAEDGVAVPLTDQLPINVFPEGEAWSASKPDFPAALAAEPGKGRVVFE